MVNLKAKIRFIVCFPDGVMEVTGQGTGKILGLDAFMATTSIGVMEDGVFSGEVNTSITTMHGRHVVG